MNEIAGRTQVAQDFSLAALYRVMRYTGKLKPASHEGMFPCEPDNRLSVQAELRTWLEQSRVIPSLRNLDNLAAACASPSKVIFLLFGTPLIIGDLVSRLRDAGKLPLANMDLLSGFARDTAAIEFLAKSGVAGIISTHQDTLRNARAHGLLAFQRTFALDSVAISNSVRSLEHFLPDVIELLPAIAAPFILPMLRAARPELPVIGCGLVRYLCQIDELVKQGITAVSVSEPSLWIL